MCNTDEQITLDDWVKLGQKIGISDRNVHVDENNDANGIFQAATVSLVLAISFCFYECQQRNGEKRLKAVHFRRTETERM